MLTPTEFSILRILLENTGNVVSSEDLFHKIWQDEYYSKSNNTITVHIRHLREKLGDSMDKKLFKSILLLITYTVVLVMVLSRLGLIAGGVAWVLGLVKPLLIGFALAFVLNRPCHFFFRLYDRGLSRTRARGAARPLAVVTSYLVLILAIAAIFSFVVPKLFTAIAFDAGGVASGPMTATFLLPLAQGVCAAVGGNIVTDAFGVVAMVAMTPLITVQLMGLMAQLKQRRARQAQPVPAAALAFADLPDDAIIEL